MVIVSGVIEKILIYLKVNVKLATTLIQSFLKRNNMNREDLYTIRWFAKKIKQESTDPHVDSLCDQQIALISQVLGEAVPEDVKPEEPDRPDTNPTVPVTTPKPVFLTKLGEKKLWYPDAIQVPKMKAKGNYPNNYPAGVVVHFTAGRYENGFENAKSSCAYGAIYICAWVLTVRLHNLIIYLSGVIMLVSPHGKLTVKKSKVFQID
jgi:hypothetical protein